jgi:6-methylsalicylate decarboxylase
LPQRFADVVSTHRRRVGHDNQEFVSAVAALDVGRTDHRIQPPADVGEEMIAGQVSVRVIDPNVPDALTEFPHDTTRAVTSLLYSGAFARFRDIHFVFPNAGGTIPMLAGRIAQTGSALFGLDKNLPNGVEYELKRLHYEIANSANRSAMAALMNLVPSSQIMFGTDCPFVPTGVTATGMVTLGLSAEDLQLIGRGNALALFPRLRA